MTWSPAPPTKNYTCNEHGKSLLTAQALVLRERDCDYNWQLRQWLNNVPAAPKVLMTDADVACANAVRSLLKKTRLSNGQNGLEKLHGGAKLPPRYFWQPGSGKKKFCHFFDPPPTHDDPTAPSRCGTA